MGAREVGFANPHVGGSIGSGPEARGSLCAPVRTSSGVSPIPRWQVGRLTGVGWPVRGRPSNWAHVLAWVQLGGDEAFHP